MTTATPPVLADYGDSAVMVTVDSADPERRRRRIVQLRDAFLAHRPHGVTDVVSGLESMLIEFDPLVTAPEHLLPILELVDEVASDAATAMGRLIDLPVVFDTETGPDLESVAHELGASVDDLIRALTAHEITIVLLAAAMAPMMSGVVLPAPVARQARPRTDVPPGSIMVAGANAIIQPFPGPTGWRVVGRTPLTIVDIHRDPPVAFGPGDRFRLRAIDASEADALAGGLLGDPARRVTP